MSDIQRIGMKKSSFLTHKKNKVIEINEHLCGTGIGTHNHVKSVFPNNTQHTLPNQLLSSERKT